MNDDVIFFKPNEIVAVIDQIQVNRLAKHLCNYFLKYAQSEIKFKDKQSSWFEFNINEVNELAQIRTKDYKLIEQSIEALMHPITVREKDDPKKYLKMVLITAVGIDSTKGVYKYQLNDIMIDLLRNTDYFTKLNLQEMNPLESKHSLVIFEWLKRYENSPQIPSMSIEELRKITGTLDKKAYDNFTNLQTRVLNTAISEITKYTPYQVSYKAIKTRARTRNKVSAIQFEFKHKGPSTVQETPKEVKQDEWESDIIRCLGMRVPSDTMYETLCEKYITENFCSTKEEFYKATYDYQLKILERFYNEKKSYKHHQNKLQNWLYKDKNKKGLERQQYHYQYCHRLIDNIPECYQHYIYDAQKSMGMGSLIQKLRTLMNETSTIDIESYL
jgi:plasmid replication initiation protein